MPTDVAVATTGEVFVSDGYCNSRILKFDPSGELLRLFPQGDGEYCMELGARAPSHSPLQNRAREAESYAGAVGAREATRRLCLSGTIRSRLWN